MPDPMIGKPEKVQMGKLKMPKNEQQRPMNSFEIISQSVAKEDPSANIDQFMQQLAYGIQKGIFKLLQIGNTVFMLQPKPDGSVEFHTATVEPVEDLIKRYQAGINSLRQMGFKKAYSYATSPAFVKIAEQTGLPVRVTQSQQVKGDEARPAYRFEVDL